MILIKPNFEIMEIMGDQPLGLIERAGRTCYKSESRISADSCKNFAIGILKRGHESVIEHSAITVKIICDRGVTHELVRHRLCAFSQESTRYCNYKGGVTFVIPLWTDLEEGEWNQVGSVVLPLKENLNATDASMLYDVPAYQWWLHTMLGCERAYIRLLKNGWSPQQARSVLPTLSKLRL